MNDAGTRWPRDEDQLFVEAHWLSGARITRGPHERRYRMPKGYKRAGDLLVEQAAEDADDRSNVIWPILFCYRQSVELFLKALIDEFASAGSQRRNTHSLAELWERLMTLVGDPEVDGTPLHLGLDAAKELVMELHVADAKSDGFRYMTDTSGRPFLFGDRALDLENLRHVMDGLFSLLECIGMALYHGNDPP